MRPSRSHLCAVSLVIGCSERAAPLTEQIEACRGRCVADPVAHCVSAGPSCANGDDCTSGLTCAFPAGPAPCVTAADTIPTCRPTHFNRLALQLGFAVGGMQISIDTTTADSSVQWKAPEHAEFMACALFSCMPSFRPIGLSPDDNDELKKIANFDQCVLIFGAFPAAQSAFVLSRESTYVGPATCLDPQPAPRVVTALAVGCWAYDTTSIIAASDLVHVPGSLLPQLPQIPHTASCEHPGTGCYDAGSDLFGVCVDGTCRRRCRTAADCALLGDTPTMGEHCGWSCEDVPGSELGACMAVP
jgi:hypothetical protein